MTDQSQVDPNTAAPAEEPPRVESKVNGANGAWDGILRLRKQVIANGETVGEIKFREPTGADIERIGNPVTFSFVANGPPRVHMEADVMTQMMAHLAGVPPSTIRQFHPRDWNNGAWLLANFFTPDLFA
jgi:hypothetical protein